ncbi:recombinase RecF [Candidatus Magnetomorum sp. HK-1]|nr:recombinase RecF [Candidatus Magnetomorum sp. HK-1]
MKKEKPYNLQKISVKGFKSIQSLTLNIAPANVLLGANGAGKSNFLSLFTFLNHLAQGKLSSYVTRNGFAHSFLFFSAKKTPRMSIDLHIDNIHYHAELIINTYDDSFIFENEYIVCHSTAAKIDLHGKPGESGLLSNRDSIENQCNILEYLKNIRVYHFHDNSEYANFKQAIALNACEYLYPNAQNIAAFLYRLRHEFFKYYHDIVTTIQTVSPFFHDFYLVPTGDQDNEKILLKWLHRNHDTPFSANQLSDGTSRFICLVVLLLQPEQLRPNIIVMDEPELGLHPAALDVLADIIQKISQENQIICTTQSVSFANHFMPENFIIVDRKNDMSTFQRLTGKHLQHWLQDFNMGDLWEKNLIGGGPEW